MERQYPCITVTSGLSGWFAVMLVWNNDFGGFPEPDHTGTGRYALQADAIREAEQWAKSDGLPFYAPTLVATPARQDVEAQLCEIMGPDLVILNLG